MMDSQQEQKEEASTYNEEMQQPQQQTQQQPYDALLNQITQLNSDLHKTAAMSQAMKEENTYLREKHEKMKQEVIKVQERYLKSQENLLLETEAKIETDKKHEMLVQKWKRQLESKAREFESLRSEFAPPKDLEQLRVKIQEEVEGPHMQRQEALQAEVKKFQEMFHTVRREYEMLKTEYEQYTINHKNELQALKASNDSQTSELRSLLRKSEELVEDSVNTNRIKELEVCRQNLDIKCRKLELEVEDAYVAKTNSAVTLEESKKDHVLAISSLHQKIIEIKATAVSNERKVGLLTDENSKLKSSKEEFQQQLLTATEEIQRLKGQVQQKELLLVENHSSMNNRIVEARSEFERERSSLKEALAVMTEKATTLDAAQNTWESSSKAKQKELISTHHQQVLDLESQLRKAIDEKEILEGKLRSSEDDIKESRSMSHTSGRKLSHEIELVKAENVRIMREKETTCTKLSQAQDLISKMKLEYISIRSKNKELENEYKTLQVKHRDALGFEQELQTEKEQLELKCRYFEEDLELLNAQVLKYKGDPLASSSSSSSSSIVGSSSNEAGEVKKLMKKCEAYKKKLLELHEHHKKLKQHAQQQAMQISKLKSKHSNEIKKLMERFEDNIDSTSATFDASKDLDSLMRQLNK